MKILNISVILTVAGLLVCPATSRAVPTPTTAATGVYDETTTQQNNVDFNATGNATTASTGNGAAYTTVNPFNSDVATAFTAGAGGVAVFDDLANGTTNTALNVTYASGAKQFTMTFSGNYTISTGINVADSTAISDSNYLEPPATSLLTITLGSITGASPGETGFSKIGLTLLSGDVTGNPGTGVNFGSVAVTAHFSDSSTASASRTITEAKGAGDTFYGFVAPDGLTITSLTLNGPFNGIPDIDDFAFITNAAVPEPATWVVPALAAVTVFGARRIRRRA